MVEQVNIPDRANPSDQTNTPPTDGRPKSCRGRGRQFTWALALVVAAGLTGALVTKAFSHGFGPGHWRGGMMGRSFDPAQVEDRADRMVRHLAVELDATSEQQDKLRAIVKAAVKDILPMRDKVQATRAQARVLLTEPTINRTEIERLRAEQIALADTFSKRVALALGDAGEILNAEQRRKLADRLPAPGSMGSNGGPMGGSGRFWNR